MKRQFARTLQRIAALSFGVLLTLSHAAQAADNTGTGDVAGDSAALVDSNVFTLFSTGGALTLVKTAFLTNHGLNILGVLEKPMLVSDLRHTLQNVRTTRRITTETDLRKALNRVPRLRIIDKVSFDLPRNFRKGPFEIALALETGLRLIVERLRLNLSPCGRQGSVRSHP